MGTTSEWLRALLWGGLWGGVMAWWMARDRGPAIFKPKGRRILYLVTWGLAGLGFGITTTFDRRAFQKPLVFVTVPVILSLLLAGWRFGKQRTVK